MLFRCALFSGHVFRDDLVTFLIFISSLILWFEGTCRIISILLKLTICVYVQAHDLSWRTLCARLETRVFWTQQSEGVKYVHCSVAPLSSPGSFLIFCFLPVLFLSNRELFRSPTARVDHLFLIAFLSLCFIYRNVLSFSTGMVSIVMSFCRIEPFIIM